MLANNEKSYPSVPLLEAGEHPVEKNTYRLPTCAMENMLNAVYGWIEKLTPGAIVYGRPRAGKTESIFEIADRLPLLLGKNVPIEIFDCARYADNPSTEGQFYEDILVQLGYSLSHSGTTTDKANRVFGYIQHQVREASDYRFILFLDEAQNLHEKHFKLLMGIHNRLKKLGIHLIIFLVGSPEILSVREAYAQSAQLQIIGRFMVVAHEFNGITSNSDMKVFLEGFDKEQYPEGSGCSYTEYFLPIAYSYGWRLNKQASLMMDCLKEKLSNETSLKFKSVDIPMQVMPPFIGYILRTLSQYDEKNIELDAAMVNDAIDYSDYIEWMRNVEELPTKTKH